MLAGFSRSLSFRVLSPRQSTVATMQDSIFLNMTKKRVNALLSKLWSYLLLNLPYSQKANKLLYLLVSVMLRTKACKNSICLLFLGAFTSGHLLCCESLEPSHSYISLGNNKCLYFKRARARL